MSWAVGSQRFRRTLVGVLIPVWMIASAGLACAQEEKKVVPFHGAQTFTHLLRYYNLKPIKKIEEISKHAPSKTLVIVLGDPQVLNQIDAETGGLAAFTKNGGALFVVSDRHFSGPLKQLGVFVVGNTVEERPKHAFRGIKACPLLKRKIQDVHPIFDGITKGIATNCPSEVYFKRGRVGMLADFTSPTPNDRNQLFGPGAVPNNPWKLKKGFAAIAGSAANAGPNDRILIIGGQGIFFNGMMVFYDDNDNFYFAKNCLDWLTNDRKRKYALVVDDGRIRTGFDVPLKQLPPRPLSPEMKINLLLQAMQEDDAFHKMLFSRISKRDLITALFIIATIFIFLRLCLHLLRNIHRREMKLPLVVRTLEKTTSDEPIALQRLDSVLAGDQFLEIASEMTRQWLQSHGIDASAGSPAVHVDGSWWQRRKWRNIINEIWHIAYGPMLGRMDRRRLRQHVGLLKKVDSAIRQGKLRLETMAVP